MRDKLLVLDADVESALKAALTLVREVPSGKAAVATTLHLHRVHACLLAARMELADLIAASRLEGMVPRDAH